ncbi:hypothetical protein [uncultured Sphingomonas sp.]|uniref:hypothetical protein n=1 Tax=uncultured Sphingomonas sp. TaxID=158754 RepID=UPI0035C9F131
MKKEHARSLAFLLASLVLTAPALASERHPRRPDPEVLASTLGSPAAQDALAATITRLASIVLDTRVGPIAALTRPRDDVRPDDTLGDIVRRDDPDFERRLQRRTRRAAETAGEAASSAITQMAELRRTAERLRDVLDPVLDEVPGER